MSSLRYGRTRRPPAVHKSPDCCRKSKESADRTAGEAIRDQGSGLRALRPVLRPSLLTAIDARSVESAANDVITDPRKILHTAAANQNDGVLLQVVTDPTNVGRHLHAVRQADTCHLSQRRVRLLGGRRIHAGAHPSTLRTPLQGRARGLGGSPLTPLPYQLVDGRQSTSTSPGLSRRRHYDPLTATEGGAGADRLSTSIQQKIEPREKATRLPSAP